MTHDDYASQSPQDVHKFTFATCCSDMPESEHNESTADYLIAGRDTRKGQSCDFGHCGTGGMPRTKSVA